MRPKLLDLCCGLRAGWTVGFQAAGYYCIGVDIADYSQEYPGDEFIQADIRDLDGSLFPNIAVMAASPPCQEFARWRMPWTRKRATLPDLSLVEACYRLRDEVQPGAFILENVQSAQRFIGPATICREPWYFWGDVALVPALGPRRTKESYAGNQEADRARIPFEIAYGLALAYRGQALRARP